MLCILDSVEVRPRINNPLPLFICTWVGVIGDSNAPKKDANGLLNSKRVQAREIQLTKNIFPVSEDDFKDWAQMLLCRRVIVPKKDSNGNYTSELQVLETPENAGKTKAYLIYKQIPLAKLGCDFSAIEFINRNGESQRQTYVNVIGWADANDNWDESQTPEEMAMANLNRNLDSGVYTPIFEEAEKPNNTIYSASVSDTQATAVNPLLNL